MTDQIQLESTYEDTSRYQDDPESPCPEWMGEKNADIQINQNPLTNGSKKNYSGNARSTSQTVTQRSY